MAQNSAKIENNTAKIGKYLQYFAVDRNIPFTRRPLCLNVDRTQIRQQMVNRHIQYS
jgi:hypothetical protein